MRHLINDHDKICPFCDESLGRGDVQNGMHAHCNEQYQEEYDEYTDSHESVSALPA